MFWLGQKKFGKRFQKSEKTAFLTSQKKLETQSGSYGFRGDVVGSTDRDVEDKDSILGFIPDSIRGFLHSSNYMNLLTPKFK